MNGRVRIGVALATLATCAAALAGAASRSEAALRLPGTWASLGLLSGSTGFGNRLADYQWDVSPRMAWGAQAMLGGGRLGAGLRLWRAASTQDLGGAGASDAAVGITSLELVGRARVLSVWGSEVALTGSTGWVRLAYDPDRVEVPAGGGAPPVVVQLEPVNSWIAGGGMAFRRPLGGPWSAGLEIEGRAFPVETAHRNAENILSGRETFSDWSARLELARLWDRR